jgi:hypothetical protein
MQMPNKQRKKYSESLETRKMQTKTTKMYQCTSIRTAKIKKDENTEWWDPVQLGLTYTAGGKNT